MVFCYNKDMKYFTWDQFKEIVGITTTTKIGNVAFQVGDVHEDVIKRRQVICDDLGIDLDHLILTHQSHSDRSYEVTSADLGKSKDSFESGPDADALYTTERGIAIGCFHADCCPLLVYVTSVPLVCIIHAGYQGTLKHVAAKTIKTLKEKYSLKGEDFYVHIGPSRQFNSFKTTEEDQKKIFDAGCEKAFRFDGDSGFFDTAFSNVNDLVAEGIPFKNITVSPIDTVDDDRCFSAHTPEKAYGRMTTLIMLK